jgi:hypothetical protein
MTLVSVAAIHQRAIRPQFKHFMQHLHDGESNVSHPAGAVADKQGGRAPKHAV